MNSSELTELLKIFEKRITNLEKKNVELEKKFQDLELTKKSRPLDSNENNSPFAKLLTELRVNPHHDKKVYSKEIMKSVKDSSLESKELHLYNSEGFNNIEIVPETIQKDFNNDYSRRNHLDEQFSSLSSSSYPVYTAPVKSNGLPRPRTLSTLSEDNSFPKLTKTTKPTGRVVTIEKSSSKSSENIPAEHVTPKAKSNHLQAGSLSPPPPSKTEMRYGLMVQIPADDPDFPSSLSSDAKDAQAVANPLSLVSKSSDATATLTTLETIVESPQMQEKVGNPILSGVQGLVEVDEAEV